MGEEKKALKKAFGLRAYMMKGRERREREKWNIKWNLKWDLLTTEDRASLNNKKENIKQYQLGEKHCLLFVIPRELSVFPHLLFFFNKFGLTWIVQWDYIIIADESAVFPTLGRTFKTKWWDALKNDASIDAVKQYFLKNPTQVSASDISVSPQKATATSHARSS